MPNLSHDQLLDVYKKAGAASDSAKKTAIFKDLKTKGYTIETPKAQKVPEKYSLSQVLDSSLGAVGASVGKVFGANVPVEGIAGMAKNAVVGTGAVGLDAVKNTADYILGAPARNITGMGGEIVGGAKDILSGDVLKGGARMLSAPLSGATSAMTKKTVPELIESTKNTGFPGVEKIQTGLSEMGLPVGGQPREGGNFITGAMSVLSGVPELLSSPATAALEKTPGGQATSAVFGSTLDTLPKAVEYAGVDPNSAMGQSLQQLLPTALEYLTLGRGKKANTKTVNRAVDTIDSGAQNLSRKITPAADKVASRAMEFGKEQFAQQQKRAQQEMEMLAQADLEKGLRKDERALEKDFNLTRPTVETLKNATPSAKQSINDMIGVVRKNFGKPGNELNEGLESTTGKVFTDVASGVYKTVQEIGKKKGGAAQPHLSKVLPLTNSRDVLPKYLQEVYGVKINKVTPQTKKNALGVPITETTPKKSKFTVSFDGSRITDDSPAQKIVSNLVRLLNKDNVTFAEIEKQRQGIFDTEKNIIQGDQRFTKAGKDIVTKAYGTLYKDLVEAAGGKGSDYDVFATQFAKGSRALESLINTVDKKVNITEANLEDLALKVGQKLPTLARGGKTADLRKAVDDFVSTAKELGWKGTSEDLMVPVMVENLLKNLHRQITSGAGGKKGKLDDIMETGTAVIGAKAGGLAGAMTAKGISRTIKKVFGASEYDLSKKEIDELVNLVESVVNRQK